MQNMRSPGALPGGRLGHQLDPRIPTRSLRTYLLFVLPLLVLSSLCAQPAEARRRKKAVVFAFRGPKALPVRTQFVKAINRRVRLISPRVFVNTAQEMGIPPLSTDAVVQVCATMHCVAVVKGNISRVGRKFTLAITVVNGANGEVIGRRRVRARGFRRLRKAARNVGRLSLRLIQRGSYSRGGVAAVASPPAPPEKQAPPGDEPPKRLPPDTDLDLERSVDENATDRQEDEAEEGEEEEDEQEEADKEEKKSSLGVFDVHASIGIAKRVFNLTGEDSSRNRKYDGGFYPEFTVGGEFYPLALLTRGFAKNIGFAASYSRHISISTDLPPNSSRPSSCNFDDKIKTKSQEFIADVKLRWPLDLATTFSPTLAAAAGFGLRDFTLGQNDVLPSFNYKFLRFGLDVKVPMGTPWIGLAAGGEFRPILAAGQEAVDALGERDGGFAWSAHAGIYGEHSSGVFYFATFQYQRFSVDFKGLDADHPVRECFPDRDDPISGSDTYMRIWVGAGYGL